MADVSVTAAEVLPEVPGTILDNTRLFGATVTAGQAVYLDTTTNTWKLADANSSAATATVGGIAMNGGAAGQVASIAVAGTLDPGFTVTVGAVYVASATAGGIAPVADLTTGWRTTVLGVGITASQLKLILVNSGVAVP